MAYSNHPKILEKNYYRVKDAIVGKRLPTECRQKGSIEPRVLEYVTSNFTEIEQSYIVALTKQKYRRHRRSEHIADSEDIEKYCQYNNNRVRPEGKKQQNHKALDGPEDITQQRVRRTNREKKEGLTGKRYAEATISDHHSETMLRHPGIVGKEGAEKKNNSFLDFSSKTHRKQANETFANSNHRETVPHHSVIADREKTENNSFLDFSSRTHRKQANETLVSSHHRETVPHHSVIVGKGEAEEKKSSLLGSSNRAHPKQSNSGGAKMEKSPNSLASFGDRTRQKGQSMLLNHRLGQTASRNQVKNTILETNPSKREESKSKKEFNSTSHNEYNRPTEKDRNPRLNQSNHLLTDSFPSISKSKPPNSAKISPKLTATNIQLEPTGIPQRNSKLQVKYENNSSIDNKQHPINSLTSHGHIRTSQLMPTFSEKLERMVKYSKRVQKLFIPRIDQNKALELQLRKQRQSSARRAQQSTNFHLFL